MNANINVLQQVTAVVEKTLTNKLKDVDRDLFASGALDSLSLVQLMVELEQQFEITISPEEIDVDDYRSVRHMANMIERITSAAILRES